MCQTPTEFRNLPGLINLYRRQADELTRPMASAAVNVMGSWCSRCERRPNVSLIALGNGRVMRKRTQASDAEIEPQRLAGRNSPVGLVERRVDWFIIMPSPQPCACPSNHMILRRRSSSRTRAAMVSGATPIVVTRISGASGTSYGEFRPVKCSSRPAFALA